MSAELVELLLPSIVHGIKLLLHRSLLDSHHKSLDRFDTITSAILFILMVLTCLSICLIALWYLALVTLRISAK